jgi:hypothetical protein
VEGAQDLTSAVLSVLRGKRLNPNHVARVVEQTNTQAYLKLYDKCAGPDRHVSFEGGPARIFEILGAFFDVPELSAGTKIGSAGRMSMPSLDYFTAPTADRPIVKRANVDEADVFPDRAPLQKVAEMVAQGSRSPGGRLQVYHSVKGAMDKTGADLASMRYRLERGAATLVGLAEQAVKEGADPASVARVMLGDQPDQTTVEIVDLTLRKMGARVEPDLIPWGREITPNHPLRVKTAELAGCAQGIVERTRTHQELKSQLDAISAVLRS